MEFEKKEKRGRFDVKSSLKKIRERGERVKEGMVAEKNIVRKKFEEKEGVVERMIFAERYRGVWR